MNSSNDYIDSKKLIFDFLGYWIEEDVGMATAAIQTISNLSRELFTYKILKPLVDSLGVKISDIGIGIICLCVDGNPGYAQLMLADLIEEMVHDGEDKISATTFMFRYMIPDTERSNPDIDDLGKVNIIFETLTKNRERTDLPVINPKDPDDKWLRHFSDKWNAQKYPAPDSIFKGDLNRVGTREFWEEKLGKNNTEEGN